MVQTCHLLNASRRARFWREGVCTGGQNLHQYQHPGSPVRHGRRDDQRGPRKLEGAPRQHPQRRQRVLGQVSGEMTLPSQKRN